MSKALSDQEARQSLELSRVQDGHNPYSHLLLPELRYLMR